MIVNKYDIIIKFAEFCKDNYDVLTMSKSENLPNSVSLIIEDIYNKDLVAWHIDNNMVECSTSLRFTDMDSYKNIIRSTFKYSTLEDIINNWHIWLYQTLPVYTQKYRNKRILNILNNV